MKKTLFALLACAAVAQAATLNWTISNVKKAGTSDNVDAGTCSSYLFVTDNSTGVALTLANEDAILGLLSAAHTGASDWSSVCSTIADASAANGTNSTAGKWAGTTGLEGFSTGSITAFAVIFDAANIAAANNYYVVSAGEVASVGFTSSAGAKTLGFGTQPDSALALNSSGTSWQSIGGTATPEPATATLSLLALAGLAARRRRH